MFGFTPLDVPGNIPSVGDDAQLRSAAFQRVRELDARFGGAIPAAAIEAGFVLHGESIHLSGRARGIFHPKQMKRGVLSIKTTIPRQGRQRRYDDIASDDGFFEYEFMGEDPQSNDNRRMSESMEDGTPLVYFHGVAPRHTKRLSRFYPRLRGATPCLLQSCGRRCTNCLRHGERSQYQ